MGRGRREGYQRSKTMRNELPCSASVLVLQVEKVHLLNSKLLPTIPGDFPRRGNSSSTWPSFPPSFPFLPSFLSSLPSSFFFLEGVLLVWVRWVDSFEARVRSFYLVRGEASSFIPEIDRNEEVCYAHASRPPSCVYACVRLPVQ